jgi:hypothetical protein
MLGTGADRRGPRLLGAFAALLLVASGLIGLAAPARAAADVGAPSWWDGDCDANHWNPAAAALGWTGAGAHRVGASYLGVPVCGPGRSSDHAVDVQWSRPGWGEYEWECVELAMRFMIQVYGTTPYNANGADVVANYSAANGGGLEVVANSTIGRQPLPGDIVSFSSPYSTAGHAAVVTASVVDAAGNGSVRVMTQNDTADGWRTLPVKAWTMQGFGSYAPYGWLHDPAGRGGPGGELAPVPVGPGAGFHALSPSRILDTRDGTGGRAAPLGPGDAFDLVVTGAGGVPSTGVSGVVVNVTATAPSEASWITVWPSGETKPNASNLNVVAGQTVANLVSTKVGAGGAVRFANANGTTELIADVVGWFDDGPAESGAEFVPVTPARLLDTRNGQGGRATPLGAGESFGLSVLGVGGVPSSGVTAVVLNITATQPTATSYLTAWPAGQDQPTASNLNVTPGDTVANLATVKVGGAGKVRIANSAGSTHVIADVVGWYGSAGAAHSRFHPLTPARVLDTRSGPSGRSTPVGPGKTLELTVAGAGGVPSAGATGVVVNITAVQPNAGGWLTAWPTGQVMPNASNLNFVPGAVVPNLAVLKVGAGGKVSIYNSAGSTAVIVDVVGWYHA